MRASRITALTFAVAALALTSGCGQSASADPAAPSISSTTIPHSTAGSPAPTSSSPTASSASSTKSAPSSSVSSPEPVVVKIPDAAKAHTQAGAVAFVKYYYETLDKLDHSPTEGVIKALAKDECQTCKEQESVAPAMLKERSHRVGAPGKVTDMKVRSDSVADQVVVSFSVHRPSGKIVNAVSGKVTSTPALSMNLEARADWVENTWKMGEIGEK